jgi:hypothetical protein
MKPREVRIDPRDFISPPYVKCPACHREDSYGVLTVNRDCFLRRCRECWHTVNYPLPPLKKKIIYLDQFVISQIMKTLNPNASAHKRVIEDGRWLDIFRRLDRLVKLQLVICPSSVLHLEESSFSPYLSALRKMYEFFASGCSFEDYEDISRGQLYYHVQSWVNGSSEIMVLDANDVIHGNPNEWQDKLNIIINLRPSPEMIQEMRDGKARMHAGYSRVFEKWQSEPNNFQYWFDKEWRAFGPTTFKCFLTEMDRKQKLAIGQTPWTLNDILPSTAYLRVLGILRGLEKAGVPVEARATKAMEYLHSDALQYLPYNRVCATLYASVAVKAGAGQKNPPDSSFAADVEIIGGLLPYCDSMFVDKYVCALLSEGPARKALMAYPCKLFSLNFLDEFMAYLDEIERSASPEHIQKVHEVYGADCEKPFEEMFRMDPPERGAST